MMGSAEESALINHSLCFARPGTLAVRCEKRLTPGDEPVGSMSTQPMAVVAPLPGVPFPHRSECAMKEEFSEMDGNHRPSIADQAIALHSGR